MGIVLRADAGLEIGTGHVMRCLTLADALREAGAATLFVTRAHPGHMIEAISERGHRTVTLAGDVGAPYGEHPAPPAHARWLQTSWRADAAATRSVLEETGAEWLVVDHYALDRAWEAAALPAAARLMVLDDLADRPHLAHVLLDQNAGREAADYTGLVPAACDLRIGPANAVLRPEFARLRPEALVRREALERPETVLVTLGGVDKDNAACRILGALAAAPAAAGLRVTVVMGASAPHLEAVRACAADMPIPADVAVNVPNMAERMLAADICIGAAGSTAWERCALGLPTLQVVLAANQSGAARSMAAEGVAVALPIPEAPEFAGALAAGLAQLTRPEAYRAMAKAAARLTDGRGAKTLVRRLHEDMSHAN